ncbi:MAG TPA: CsgG/HfaB family protein, partial [Gemmatimonadaceae bacterium]|nr:CsgG/HfaB family protein [Gemmatimonadaceae bacterium]
MTSLPAHTRTVLGVALTIGVAFAAPARAQRPDSLPTVAVMYFDNGALVDRAMYDPMRKGLTELLITELQGNPRIRVVEREALQRILEEQ